MYIQTYLAVGGGLAVQEVLALVVAEGRARHHHLAPCCVAFDGGRVNGGLVYGGVSVDPHASHAYTPVTPPPPFDPPHI